jgi:hypothetical protein
MFCNSLVLFSLLTLARCVRADNHTNHTDHTDDGLDGGAIAGITLGCIAAIAAIGALVWFFFLKEDAMYGYGMRGASKGASAVEISSAASNGMHHNHLPMVALRDGDEDL